MRFKDEATLKRLHNEADGNTFRRNTHMIEDNDEKLIMPVVRLLHCILINSYQN